MPRPREYVLDGVAIRTAEGFESAVDEALYGPVTESTRFDYDGFSDWIDVVWPRDSVLVWTNHAISKGSMSVTRPRWRGETEFEAISGILDVREIPYRLE